MSGFNGNRGRGRGAGGQRRAPVSVRAQVGALKSALHGHANKLGGNNPPQFTRRPYGAITVEETATSATDDLVSVAQVMTALKAQLGTTSEICIKVHRVDVWVMPTGGSENLNAIPTVRARFFSLVPNVSTEGIAHITSLKSLEDIGCPGASAAVVSYTWPRDQQDMPLVPVSGSGDIPVLEYTIAPNCTAYIRYHLHWSLIDPYTSPTFRVPLSKSSSQQVAEPEEKC